MHQWSITLILKLEAQKIIFRKEEIAITFIFDLAYILEPHDVLFSEEVLID